MPHEIKIECPNCSEPISVTPDKLSQKYITCGHCAMKHEVGTIKIAVKNELNALVNAYNEYLETADL